MRSATAPDTMVAAVAANTIWKTHWVPSPRVASGLKNPVVPMKLPAPYANAEPTAQYDSAPTIMSVMFFIVMLPAFLPRVSPTSTMVNPACMRNTRAAAMPTNTTVRFAARSSGVTPSCAKAAVAPRTLSAPVATATVISLFFTWCSPVGYSGLSVPAAPARGAGSSVRPVDRSVGEAPFPDRQPRVTAVLRNAQVV